MKKLLLLLQLLLAISQGGLLVVEIVELILIDEDCDQVIACYQTLIIPDRGLLALRLAYGL